MDPDRQNPELRPSAHSDDSPPDDIRRMFFGPHGLRAGWSLAFYASILFALYIVAGSFVSTWLGSGSPGELSPVPTLLGELLLFFLVLFATGVMARIEHCSVFAYGLRGRAPWLRLVSGLLWGFVAISAMVFSLVRLGYLAVQPSTLAAGPALRDALLWAATFLLTGLFEESLFRGYAQFTLARGIGFWWGAILASALFAFGHTANPGESPVGIVSVVGIGLVFCLSLWYTGSLWWAIGFHAAWDWGQSFFYGTPDSGARSRGHLFTAHALGPLLLSGGATGPEGSLLIIPLLALMTLLMFLWWGRRTRSPFAGAAWRPIQPTLPSPPAD